MGKKIEAAIPDSDLDLHIHGCWGVLDEVAVHIEGTDSANRTVHCVCEAEGIDDWFPIEEVSFVWPDMGYVNTSTGAVYCTRRAANGRHYRRAFNHNSFDIMSLAGDSMLRTRDGRVNSIVQQLFAPSYPTAAQGISLLKLGLRPSIALSKEVALTLWEDGILVHVGGRCVGSLDYCDGNKNVTLSSDQFVGYLERKLEVLYV